MEDIENILTQIVLLTKKETNYSILNKILSSFCRQPLYVKIDAKKKEIKVSVFCTLKGERCVRVGRIEKNKLQIKECPPCETYKKHF